MDGCKVRFLQYEGRLLSQQCLRSISTADRDFYAKSGLWGDRVSSKREMRDRLLANQISRYRSVQKYSMLSEMK